MRDAVAGAAGRVRAQLVQRSVVGAAEGDDAVLARLVRLHVDGGRYVGAVHLAPPRSTFACQTNEQRRALQPRPSATGSTETARLVLAAAAALRAGRR